MRGAEEHDIYKSVGRNILKEVYERIQGKSGKDGIDINKLHYINEGASLKVNFAREMTDGSTVYGTIGLQTNNTDKAYTIQGSIKASEKSNGMLNSDVRFVTNANAVGNFASDTFYVSPQATYLRTPHGKNQVLRHATMTCLCSQWKSLITFKLELAISFQMLKPRSKLKNIENNTKTKFCLILQRKRLNKKLQITMFLGGHNGKKKNIFQPNFHLPNLWQNL